MKPRTWTIRPGDDDKPLADVVAGILHASRARAAAAIRRGDVRVQGQVCRQPGRVLRSGQRVSVAREEYRRPELEPSKGAKPFRQKPSADGPKLRIVYQDDDLIVVDKPAGLTTVRHADELAEAGSRAQRFLPPTLIDLLPSAVKGPTQGRFRLRAVHRLDRDTSGLVVVARHAEAERKLGKQFRVHSIERRYLALVRGAGQSQVIESRLVRDRGDGRRGTGSSDEGQRAVTRVRLVEQFAKGALVECTLETGRTHQVRIHLGEQGTPLCGERIYDRSLHGQPSLDPTAAERPMLHAAFLAVDHPRTGKRLSWSSPPPNDFEACLESLRTP
jgi:23S rRNA pseudouridine1911/1915/1917 synthase